MKKGYLAIIALCCAAMACQKNAGEIEKNDAKEPPVLKLWAGADSTVPLASLKLTGSAFTVSNDHPEIAQVTTDGHHLTIRSHKPGKATVLLKNEQQQQFKVLVWPIDMLSDYPGNWVSVAKDGMKSYVTVRTGDQKLTDSLYQALSLKLYDNGVSGTFRYAFTTGQFRFTATKTAHGIKEGTWTYDRLRLTLNYTDAKELYQVIPVQSINVIELRSVLTEALQQQFPDAGITEVSTHQYLAYQRFL
ncbi:hypothetical protein LL912_10210 [Niabella sp. CC-SYL272]|uniref:hypothetical protein n=1 Tax=Niabella agricola TaxID=2891571 RepID=UPI001F2C2DE8|nr:hypothetical protein [Niabella agricola]MCF3109151.1 hypothetical protein [Niabella agricola]